MFIPCAITSKNSSVAFKLLESSVVFTQLTNIECRIKSLLASLMR
jgi:hypothetical protein